MRYREKILNNTKNGMSKESLGVENQLNSGNRRQFMDLFGTWNEKDKAEIDKTVSDFEKIDSEDWRE